jgi:hypothetical protein
MSTETTHIEDVAAAIAAGRKPRLQGPYRVEVGDAELAFRPVRIDDPVPTGRQILEAAGVRRIEEYLLFLVLSNGELEELRLDETTDLRGGGVARFLIFASAESYRIELDRKVFEWGACAISGRVLKRLAGVDPATYGVWLEVRGGEDQPIGDSELIRLDGKGLERFFTGITQTTEGAA